MEKKKKGKGGLPEYEGQPRDHHRPTSEECRRSKGVILGERERKRCPHGAWSISAKKKGKKVRRFIRLRDSGRGGRGGKEKLSLF